MFDFDFLIYLVLSIAVYLDKHLIKFNGDFKIINEINGTKVDGVLGDNDYPQL